MKKKFVAGLCAFALALAMPAAALADISPEKVTEENGVTTVDFGEDGYGIPQWFYNSDTGEWESTMPLEKIAIEGADNVSVSDSIDWGAYDADKVKEYNKMLSQVEADKGKYMFQIEINGDVPEGQHAVVTFTLDKDKYGNKTIAYYILHKDGSIQKKVVDVHSDGTVTIWMDSFSIITFMDVEGIEKYENMVEPQDGDLLAPKTGC